MTEFDPDWTCRPVKIGRLAGRPRRKSTVDKFGHYGSFNQFQTENGDFPVETTKDIIMGAESFRDFHITKFIQTRMAKNISTINEKITVSGNKRLAMKYIRDNWSEYCIYTTGRDHHIVTFEEAIIEVEANHNTIDFRIHGSLDIIDRAKEELLKTFDEIVVYIKWVYDSQGSSAYVPLDSKLVPFEEMYPWLNGESLESYYSRYQKSSASVLVLIGPPGTGKTSFLRGYLTSTESSAVVTYDPKVMNSDSLFADFIDSDNNALIVEDADLLLSSRKDGNDLMSKFLNVADGLVTIKDKKIIFSTNLPSINDIDPALLRPGRCHEVVSFNTLTPGQAKIMADKIGINFDTSSASSFTVADVFSGVKTNTATYKKSGFGFC